MGISSAARGLLMAPGIGIAAGCAVLASVVATPAFAVVVCNPDGSCFNYERLPPIVNTLGHMDENDPPLKMPGLIIGPFKPTPTFPPAPDTTSAIIGAGDVQNTTTSQVSNSDSSTTATSVSIGDVSSETTDNSDHSNHSVNHIASNSGEGAVASGGDATYVNNSTNAMGWADPGGAVVSSTFGDGAIATGVSLAGSVSGNTITFNMPTDGGPGPTWFEQSIEGTAFQNAAGLVMVSQNNGAAAMVNQNQSVNAPVGSITLP